MSIGPLQEYAEEKEKKKNNRASRIIVMIVDLKYEKNITCMRRGI